MLMPGATWDEIKARNPGFVKQWKPDYEPLPMITPHSQTNSKTKPSLVEVRIVSPTGQCWQCCVGLARSEGCRVGSW